MAVKPKIHRKGAEVVGYGKDRKGTTNGKTKSKQYRVYLAWDRQPSTQTWIQRHALLRHTDSAYISWRLLRELATHGEIKGDTTTLEDFTVIAKLREAEEG